MLNLLLEISRGLQPLVQCTRLVVFGGIFDKNCDKPRLDFDIDPIVFSE